MRLMRQQKLDTPLTRLRDQIDRMFQQPDFSVGDLLEGWMPAVDVLEDKDKLTVKAELPGFKREDINVSLHEDNLVISGERRCEEEQKEGEFYRCERNYGRFHRAVSLPSSVDMEKIDARYRDGILTVTLPKSEKARGKQIEVSVE
jgi:HSP20 family protein